MGGKRDEDDLPSDDEAIEREAEASREREEAIPPPGTDPLHEGP